MNPHESIKVAPVEKSPGQWMLCAWFAAGRSKIPLSKHHWKTPELAAKDEEALKEAHRRRLTPPK